MSMTRALAMPFHATSLMFVAFTTLVLSLFGTLGESHAPGQLLVTWLMLSWLNKYAFALLDHAANGRPGAPVASTEMLGPLGDLRVLVHPAIGLGLAVLTWTTSLAVAPVTVAALLLMPASLAGMTMTGQLRDAVNPLSLWHAIRGLGVQYLVPLGLMAGFPMVWMARSAFDLSRPLFVLLSTLLGLCLYAGLGGAIHARRLDLDFEPALSPERVTARKEDERRRSMQATLDAVYLATQAGNLDEGASRLAAQLAASAGRGTLAADVDQAIEQALQWPRQGAVAATLRTAVRSCIAAGEPGLALRTAEAGATRHPEFFRILGADGAILADYARNTGRPALARRLQESCSGT